MVHESGHFICLWHTNFSILKIPHSLEVESTLVIQGAWLILQLCLFHHSYMSNNNLIHLSDDDFSELVSVEEM